MSFALTKRNHLVSQTLQRDKLIDFRTKIDLRDSSQPRNLSSWFAKEMKSRGNENNQAQICNSEHLTFLQNFGCEKKCKIITRLSFKANDRCHQFLVITLEKDANNCSKTKNNDILDDFVNIEKKKGLRQESSIKTAYCSKRLFDNNSSGHRGESNFNTSGWSMNCKSKESLRHFQ